MSKRNSGRVLRALLLVLLGALLLVGAAFGGLWVIARGLKNKPVQEWSALDRFAATVIPGHASRGGSMTRPGEADRQGSDVPIITVQPDSAAGGDGSFWDALGKFASSVINESRADDEEGA